MLKINLLEENVSFFNRSTILTLDISYSFLIFFFFISCEFENLFFSLLNTLLSLVPPPIKKIKKKLGPLNLIPDFIPRLDYFVIKVRGLE